MGMVASILLEFLYYPEPDELVAEATFTILEDAPEGTETLLTFDDECCGRPQVDNCIVFDGRSISPDLVDVEISITRAVAGKVKVIAETTIFLRADANGNGGVDLADATWILQYLFVDGPASTCPDAADANDDGRVNIADPVAILQTLFTPADIIAAPYPKPGEDETADALGPCFY
jgi:hypothetical protein